MKKVLLKAGSVVTPQGVLQTDIIIADGKIKLAAKIKKSDGATIKINEASFAPTEKVSNNKAT